jgi:hypothetical protein
MFNSLKRVIYPTEMINYQMSDYFSILLEDETFLNAFLLSHSVYRDHLTQETFSPMTCFHLRRTLSSLNKKLADRESCLADTTFFVVLLLGGMAHSLGDLTAAEAHLLGLRRLVDLRGGLQGLRRSYNLYFKVIWYVDLIIQSIGRSLD